jgi:hypothetical protein
VGHRTSGSRRAGPSPSTAPVSTATAHWWEGILPVTIGMADSARTGRSSSLRVRPDGVHWGGYGSGGNDFIPWPEVRRMSIGDPEVRKGCHRSLGPAKGHRAGPRRGRAGGGAGDDCAARGGRGGVPGLPGVRRGGDEVARKVMGLVDRAESKRRQVAPGSRVSPLAFGPDRRMPIANRFTHRPPRAAGRTGSTDATR